MKVSLRTIERAVGLLGIPTAVAGAGCAAYGVISDSDRLALLFAYIALGGFVGSMVGFRERMGPGGRGVAGWFLVALGVPVADGAYRMISALPPQPVGHELANAVYAAVLSGILVLLGLTLVYLSVIGLQEPLPE